MMRPLCHLNYDATLVPSQGHWSMYLLHYPQLDFLKIMNCFRKIESCLFTLDIIENKEFVVELSNMCVAFISRQTAVPT